MHNTITYTVSGLFSATSFIAQLQPIDNWHSLAIQAGMAGVVVLLLLKFFPMLIKHLEKKDAEHQTIIREIVTANQAKDEAWQRIISEHKLCNKNGN
jgi:predicted regulator of amino acid metabolism with ACT domain